MNETSEPEKPHFDPRYWMEVPLIVWLQATTHARTDGGEQVPYHIDTEEDSLIFYWSRNPEHREEIAVLTRDGRCYLNTRFFEPGVKFLPSEAAH